jgi:hypothetical protein
MTKFAAMLPEGKTQNAPPDASPVEAAYNSPEPALSEAEG